MNNKKTVKKTADDEFVAEPTGLSAAPSAISVIRIIDGTHATRS